LESETPPAEASVVRPSTGANVITALPNGWPSSIITPLTGVCRGARLQPIAVSRISAQVVAENENRSMLIPVKYPKVNSHCATRVQNEPATRSDKLKITITQ